MKSTKQREFEKLFELSKQEGALHGSTHFVARFFFATAVLSVVALLLWQQFDAWGKGQGPNLAAAFASAILTGSLPGLFLFFYAFSLLRSETLHPLFERLLKTLTCVVGYLFALFCFFWALATWAPGVMHARQFGIATFLFFIVVPVILSVASYRTLRRLL